MTPYDALITAFDLPAAVLALESRDLARVIGRDAARDDFPDMTTRELAESILLEAGERVLAKHGIYATLPWGTNRGIIWKGE